jgi:hypothetical protein
MTGRGRIRHARPARRGVDLLTEVRSVVADHVAGPAGCSKVGLVVLGAAFLRSDDVVDRVGRDAAFLRGPHLAQVVVALEDASPFRYGVPGRPSFATERRSTSRPAKACEPSVAHRRGAAPPAPERSGAHCGLDVRSALGNAYALLMSAPSGHDGSERLPPRSDRTRSAVLVSRQEGERCLSVAVSNGASTRRVLRVAKWMPCLVLRPEPERCGSTTNRSPSRPYGGSP